MSLFSRITVVGCLALLVFGRPLLAAEDDKTGDTQEVEQIADKDTEDKAKKASDDVMSPEKPIITKKETVPKQLVPESVKEDAAKKQADLAKVIMPSSMTALPSALLPSHPEIMKVSMSDTPADREKAFQDPNVTGLDKDFDAHAAVIKKKSDASPPVDAESHAGQPSAETKHQENGTPVDEGWKAELDTLNFKTGGNWLLKRMWWEKTELLYEKVKQHIAHLMQLRAPFFKRQANTDQKLSQFYVTAGLEQGELIEIAHVLAEQLAQEEQRNDLDDKEREFQKNLADKKRQIEQLTQDIQTLQDLEQAIDEAVTVLLQQIDRAQGYEAEVWKYYKQIARELNDREAEVLYTKSEALVKSVESIIAYVQGAFSQHFSTMESHIDTNIATMHTALASLKTAGLDLQHEWAKLKADDERRVQDVVHHEQSVAQSKTAQLEKELAEAGIVGTVTSWASRGKDLMITAATHISSLVYAVWETVAVTPYRWIVSWFGDSKLPKKGAENIQADKEQHEVSTAEEQGLPMDASKDSVTLATQQA